MPMYIKIIVSLIFVRRLIYLVSYAFWEIKNGTKKGGAAAMCTAAASFAAYAAAIAFV